MSRVLIVPNDVLLAYREDAFKIVKNIDKDDVLFIACALAYPGSIIWSNDKKLKQQPRIKVLNTEEMISYLRDN